MPPSPWKSRKITTAGASYHKTAKVVIAAVLATLGLTLAGCAGGQSATGSGDSRFVAGLGEGQLVPAAQRKPAPPWTGRTLQDEVYGLNPSKDSAVVVINFWASWCAPCRGEAAALKQVAQETKADGVEFVGINIKDSKGNALAYERTYQPGYPSVFDQPGEVAQAFKDSVPPQAIPSTLVIDRKGRIAARVIGPVTYSRLKNFVTQVAREKT